MPFANPSWLFTLLLIPIIGVGAVFVSRGLARKWGRLVADRLRRHLIRRPNPVPRWLSFAFLLAAGVLIIFGMARPRSENGTATEKSKGRDLLLALDLSRSMRTEDVKPDRLSLAKLAIYEMLEAMPDDRIGLIGFAGDAHLYAPLTIDHNAVREMVEQMDETWPTIGGSDLGAAVSLGIETLEQPSQRNHAMVILTDGEKHSGNIERMIKQAREAGLYIITVGVGTEDGAYIPNPKAPDKLFRDRNGKPVLSRLQTEVLEKLAHRTNGDFAIAGSGADIPAMVSSAIAGLDAFELEGRERTIYIEFYQWLVLPAILLLIASMIAGTRWRGITPASAATLLTLCLTSLHAPAQEEAASSQKGQMEHYGELADKALLHSRRTSYRLMEATAAYRLMDWDRASSAYSEALKSHRREVRSSAHHGLGNTLFQQGWQRFMEGTYTAEIDSVPAMKRFDLSVRAKLERLKNRIPGEEVDPDEFDYTDIEMAILDWTDSARHFRSVLSMDPKNEGAQQNLELTTNYLRRLRELLEEDENKTEQSMPETMESPQPGDGDPQDGNQDPGDDSGDQGNDGSQEQSPPEGDPSGDNGDQESPEGDPNNGDQQPQEREQDPNDEIPDHSDNVKPGETPDERARRILRESSDLEKGPILPGQRRWREPDKDW